MFVLDTNVVSELRKSHKAHGNVTRWASSVPATSLFISAVTVLELETGVLLVERRDPAQGAALRRWLDGHVMTAFMGRVLPFDSAVARRCAALHVPDRCSDRDAIIAASALVHGMAVITRNVADFVSSGVAVLNPWEAA